MISKTEKENSQMINSKEKETNEEFIKNTQHLLSKVGLDIVKTNDMFNKIIKMLDSHQANESYLVLTTICKYISDSMNYKEEEIDWFDYVAARCMVIEKNLNTMNKMEGIH